METCIISISMVVSECSPSKYCDKNQRKIYFLSSYFLYYMHLKKIFGCYTLVTTRLLILEWFLRTHPCDCWGFWSAKYNLCNHGKPSKKSIWFIWFAWQSHVYVENKGSNLNTLTNVLKYVVFCYCLQLLAPFVQDHVLATQC